MPTWPRRRVRHLYFPSPALLLLTLRNRCTQIDQEPNIQIRIESLNMEVNSSNELKASRYGPKNLFRLSGLSIRTRLTACFVAIVVLMMAVDGLTVWQFRRMAAAVEGLSNADQTSLAVIRVHLDICLLYTSDAADERSSVDLGGR